jgi:hypothetical protein
MRDFSLSFYDSYFRISNQQDLILDYPVGFCLFHLLPLPLGLGTDHIEIRTQILQNLRVLFNVFNNIFVVQERFLEIRKLCLQICKLYSPI